MDRIEKALKKLANKEKAGLKIMLKLIMSGDFKGLDIKKLKGRSDIYRARKGRLRIIYRIDKDKKIYILAIERRGDTTYN